VRSSRRPGRRVRSSRRPARYGRRRRACLALEKNVQPREPPRLANKVLCVQSTLSFATASLHSARRPEGPSKSALGEVGGAQRAERASTDGCHRRSPTCSEGAAVEREEFSAVLAGCAGRAPRNVEFTRAASEFGLASCIRVALRLGANPPAMRLVRGSSCPARQLRFEAL